MSATRPGAILRHLHPADPDDGPLLARFAGRRDPAAFAALVRRHGPMVLAVCRRVTGHPQDAEDAFQAAFLVLARSAGTVRAPERLGSWLYGVAVKVAGRARRTAARRRRREVTVAAFPDVPAPDPAPPDIGPALHEELAALPALHREPIVLCDLQGLSRAEAARALGIAEGTLSSRLANGRKRLAARLTRRGVVLSLAAVSAAVADGRAAVPDELVSNTCGLAAAWAAGAPLPAAVVRLARGGFPMRGVLLGGFLSFTLVAGAVLAAGHADAPRPPDPPRPPGVTATVAVVPDAEEQQPKKDAPAKVGAPRLKQMQDLSVRQARNVAWSGDGNWLVVGGVTGDPVVGPGGFTPAGGSPFGKAGGIGKAGILTPGKATLAVVSMKERGLTPAYVPLPPATKLVGFAANNTQFFTETNESGLISGAHTLQTWDATVRTPAVGEPGIAVTPSALASVTEDAALLTPGIASYEIRYLARQADKAGVRKVEVRRTDLRNGEDRAEGKFEGTFKTTQLTTEGRRVVVTTDAGVVEVYSADDGKKQWASAPPPKAPNITVRGPADRQHPTHVAAARDGSRLLVVRGLTVPTVLDGETGKALPAPEGIEVVETFGMSPAHVAVSGNGRLAALVYAPLEKVTADPKSPFGGPINQLGLPVYERGTTRLMVWDTTTGKVVRTWTGAPLAITFHPTRPVLAILEANGTETRLGLWEFPAE